MKRFLEIVDGVAQNEWWGGVPPQPAPPRRMVDVTDRAGARVGMSYDAGTDTFTAPPATPDYGQSVGVRDFMRLFTPAQRQALRQAAKTDAAVEDWAAIAQVPEPIRLGHPDTAAGLGLLVVKGLITEDDRARILRGERP